MDDARRLRPCRLIGIVVVALMFVVLLSRVAMATDETEEDAPAASDPACSVTGHVVTSQNEEMELRRELQAQDLQLADGMPLDGADTWVLPDGGSPVVVLDSNVALPDATISVAAGGATFEIASADREDAGNRYVTNAYLPHLGATTRTLGFEVESGSCAVQLTLSVDRSLWSSAVGAGSVAVTALFGALTVVVARLRRGSWHRRFLLAAPLGAIAGIGLVLMLHEARALDAFGSLPWWGPLGGVAFASVLPLTRWPSQERSSDEPPGPESPEELTDANTAANTDTAAADADSAPEDAAPSSSKVSVLVNSAAPVVVAAAVGLTALLVDSELEQPDVGVITPQYARFVFSDTVTDGLSGQYGPTDEGEEEPAEYIREEFQGMVDEFASSDDSLPDAEPTEIEVGIPPGQSEYPAWFVGSAQIPHDDGIASAFARFDRESVDEPWQMTSFTGLTDDVLPGPALDDDGNLSSPPDAAELSLNPEEIAELYVDWTDRQSDASHDNDGKQLDDNPGPVDDDVLALRPGAGSFLQNYFDNFVGVPTDLQFLPPDDLEQGGTYSFPTDRDVSSEPREPSIIHLEDGTAFVSFTMDATETFYNGERDDDDVATTGRCGPNPRIEHEGDQYRLFATDYEIFVQAWVPLGAADDGDDDDEAVPLSDLIVSTDRPSDRSELC